MASASRKMVMLLIASLACIFTLVPTLGAQTATKYIYWLENIGALQVVYDGTATGRFICGDIRPQERLRIRGVVDGYYQLQMPRGDCRGGIGYVAKEGPFQLYRSLAQTEAPTPPSAPLPAAPKPLPTLPKTKASSSGLPTGFKAHWDVEPRGYLAFSAATSFGLAAFEENAFGLAIEPGWIPNPQRLFSLGLPIRYSLPSPIDIGSNIVLDVHLLQIGLRPQYRLVIGDSSHFMTLATDLGVAIAFGEFSATIDQVTDYSLWIRPTVGYGYQSPGSPVAYIFEIGSSLMPIGFGVLGATVDAAFSVQYGF